MVFEVEDKQSMQRYAAKLIHPQYTRDTDAANKMIAEVEAIREIRSDHIAQVITVGMDTGKAISVIRELMNGHCLSTRMQQVGQFSMRSAFYIIREILVSLDSIHQKGILNLDLSPGDVFLAKSSAGSTVKLVDLGESHIKQTLSGEAPISYRYYAPEQMDRSRQPGVKADIYAAGAILYEMLVGAPLDGEPAPLRSVRKDVPPQVAELVAKAIDFNPAKRFESVGEFIAAIDDANIEATTFSSQPAPANFTTKPSPNAPVADAMAVQAPSSQESPAGSGMTVSTPQQNGQAQPEPAAMPQPAAFMNAQDSAQGGPPDAAQVDREPSQPSVEQDTIDPQASVIVEMPEIDRRKSKKLLLTVVTLLILGALVTGYLINGRFWEDAGITPTELEISIEVVPKHAVIIVDGNRMEGNPVSMKVVPDGRLHTILAKADGYEQKERDIRFDKARTIQLDLAEIIQPDEPADEQSSTAPSEIQEVEAPPPPPSEAPTSSKPAEIQKSVTPKRQQKNVSAKRSKGAKLSKKGRATPAGSSKSKTTKKTSGKSGKAKVEGFRTSNPFN